MIGSILAIIKGPEGLVKNYEPFWPNFGDYIVFGLESQALSLIYFGGIIFSVRAYEVFFIPSGGNATHVT